MKAVVISIDLEMRWGMHDRLGLDFSAYRTNLEGGRSAISGILKELTGRRLKATWAAVGALACSGWDEYFRRAPATPGYLDRNLAVNPRYAELDPRGDLHFAPAELELIARSGGQELGTHTFSHIYLREPGVTGADFAADLDAVNEVWREKFESSPTSLVFPRNQCNFLDVVAAKGIKCWRGNPKSWYHNRVDAESNGPLSRALRYLDAHVPLSRVAEAPEGPMCRASIFVRFNLPEALWRLHVNRIVGELDSMIEGANLHIWFHEHNLGADPRRAFSRLSELCDYIQSRRETGLITSLNMADLAGQSSH